LTDKFPKRPWTCFWQRKQMIKLTSLSSSIFRREGSYALSKGHSFLWVYCVSHWPWLTNFLRSTYFWEYQDLQNFKARFGSLRVNKRMFLPFYERHITSWALLKEYNALTTNSPWLAFVSESLPNRVRTKRKSQAPPFYDEDINSYVKAPISMDFAIFTQGAKGLTQVSFL